jgi:hypothetical protein
MPRPFHFQETKSMKARPDGGRLAAWRAVTTAGALALCLAGCQKAAEPADVDAAGTADAGADVASDAATRARAAPVAPTKPGEWTGTVPDKKAAAAEVAADDLFVGWYYEQGGAGRLLACGQSVSLQVSDPTFLRNLKARMGGGPEPVYVRLKVRPVAQSQLQVSDVQQFGVDEGPAPNCHLVAQRN